MIRYLIVNADDFGASRGINRGIIEARRHGILTSTSLMVNMPCSEEAALLSRHTPDMSVGLHIQLTSEEGQLRVDPANGEACRAELGRQIRRFVEIMGRLPTHLDSHHNIHRDARLLPLFLDLAQAYDLPMREHSPVRYFSAFYGQWDGDTHLEQIGVDSLSRMLEADVAEGITELSCHPGYTDPQFRSDYAIERETELRTLCDPTIRRKVEDLGIQLMSFRDLSQFAERATR